MTLAQKIIAAHANRDRVEPGELVTVPVDRVYLQDGNSPTIRNLFAEHGFTNVFDSSRIGVFFDHSVLAPDVKIADRLREAEEFAEKFGLCIFKAGTGISHVVALEKGWFEPETIVVGSDSHTCTGGAVQCLALGMGASDVVAAMVTGKTWLRVPETAWIEVCGVPQQFTRTKDIMLYTLAKLGQKPFLYKSVEWSGKWFDTLSLDGAATIANMAVELGAKCSFLPEVKDKPYNLLPIELPSEGDPRRFRLDIDGLPPFIAKPHSPSNAVPLDECYGQKINYVFIGSCTNSRLEDIAEVARVLAEEKVHPKVHCLVTPGSEAIYLEALHLGYIETIMRAGGIITPPGCGACLGTQGTIPATGDRVLSTMNRNFLGRMGNPKADIWLASPLIAAHTAIRGEIPGTGDLS
ncbi:MAG: aconitase/3-isopropylmalate dehydratase large subunit family protein [Rhizonema sp. PD37]|nr:aconitase/3-isopropylmalate dehydratase large subunit family protein [Rhizonema sp. PD37]